jgi:hypothetical protein
MPFLTSIDGARYSWRVVLYQHSHYYDNTLSLIMHNSSGFLVLKMDSVHQLQKVNISRLLKVHGDDQVNTMHSVKCLSLIKDLINWLPHKWTSPAMEC